MTPGKRFVWLALLATASLAACSSTSTVAKHARVRAPSSNPYVASLAYARCVRRHGVPHPDPDRRGDFNLTAAQERALRRVPATKRKAAMKACFHNLKGLNMQPLSEHAKARAIKVLLRLRRCLRGYGIEPGDPVVENKSFGRALFGFENGTPGPPSSKVETLRAFVKNESTWLGRSARSLRRTGGLTTPAVFDPVTTRREPPAPGTSRRARRYKARCLDATRSFRRAGM